MKIYNDNSDNLVIEVSQATFDKIDTYLLNSVDPSMSIKLLRSSEVEIAYLSELLDVEDVNLRPVGSGNVINFIKVIIEEE